MFSTQSRFRNRLLSTETKNKRATLNGRKSNLQARSTYLGFPNHEPRVGPWLRNLPVLTKTKTKNFYLSDRTSLSRTSFGRTSIGRTSFSRIYPVASIQSHLFSRTCPGRSSLLTHDP